MNKKVKVVPMEKVLELMAGSCKEHQLHRSEAQIIDAMLAAFPATVVHNEKYVLYEDVFFFMDNWVRALKSKDFNFLTMKRGKKCEPVDMETFLESPEYLNQASQIRPAIKKEVLRLYENGGYYPEVILTGATGVGKDYFAYLIVARTLYELWCYYNPQIEFGLAAGTSIIIAIQSITKELAKKVTFDELVGTVLSNAKFFHNHFMWDKTVTSELRFPGNLFVRPFSGEDTAALGMAIFTACFPGHQEYVVREGYERFDTCKNSKVITSDGIGVWETSEDVSSVITGVDKELVRLWFGDSYIDCTPNQRFKDINNEWVYAYECAGIELISFNSDGTSSICLCTMVEYLDGTYTVYDLKDVPETNTLIVPTSDKSIHLVAHNCTNEMSFMRTVAKSKKLGGAEFNQAARIYKTLSRRIKGRFIQHGKIPGKMVLISSANQEGDFIHKRLAEVEEMKPEDKEKVFIMKMSQWESFSGMDRLLEETFLVEKGNDIKRSRIIESMDEAIDPEDVIEVPMDYHDDFEKDIDGSLADIGGEFVAGGRKKFIPYKEDIALAVQKHKELNDGQQLFRKPEIVFDKEVDQYNPDYTNIVNMEYLQTILNPTAPFAIHIDYGFTGDATGLAVSHISSYALVGKARVYDAHTNSYRLVENTKMPVYHIDGVIAITASSGSEVDIDFIEGLVYFLQEHLNIRWASFDSYESRASKQGFRKKGIISGVVSTVTNPEPYAELKNCIKTGRLLIPDHPLLQKEIKNLERLPNGKIEHPTDSSKDCSDAVAGSIYVLMTQSLKQSDRAGVRPQRQQTQERVSSGGGQPTVRRSRFSRV